MYSLSHNGKKYNKLNKTAKKLQFYLWQQSKRFKRQKDKRRIPKNNRGCSLKRE